MQYAVRNWNLVLQSARRPCGFMKFLGGNVVIEEVLGRVSAGEDLSMAEMADTIGSIMQGEWGDAQIAVLLTALRSKGETVAEVAGARHGDACKHDPDCFDTDRFDRYLWNRRGWFWHIQHQYGCGVCDCRMWLAGRETRQP